MIGSRSGFLVLAAACVLLLIEATTLIGTRWVEDESWIASGSWTFAQEGRIRTAIFPSEPSYEIAVGLFLSWCSARESQRRMRIARR